MPDAPAEIEASNALTLDPAQQDAVDHDAGPLIVLAGPGSGKTRIIIARIARLIRDGVDPQSILALTFTVKAAEEMRSRLEHQVGASMAARVRCRTFHSFGYDLIRRYPDLIGLPHDWRIIDSAERRRMLRRIVVDHDLFADRTASGREGVLNDVADFIESCRQVARFPPETIRYAEQWLARAENHHTDDEDEKADALADLAAARSFAACARAYEHFEVACIKSGSLTFDDFIMHPIRLLRTNENTASIVRSEAHHVLVDEFQDVNAAQLEMLRLIAPPRGHGRAPDLVVVGDDDQAIYGFRGAEPKAFERFARIWTSARTIPLTINYRSAPDIVNVAQHIIALATTRFAPDKQLRPSDAWRPDALGDLPSVEPYTIAHDDSTGALIAALIRNDITQSNRPWSDFAVIVRTNTRADTIAEELRLHGIPVDRRHAATPLDDPAVQDLLAWMRLLTGHDVSSSVHRLLLRPPALIAPATLVDWAGRFRASHYRPSPGSRDFIAWLRANAGRHGGVKRFLKKFDALRDKVQGENASRAAYAILRTTGLLRHVRRDSLDADRTLLNMTRVLAFIKDRLPALESPADLASFMHHHDDLDDQERQFESPGIDQLDTYTDAATDENRADAVTVVTAHKAKGLQFDTVFLPKVRKGGYPFTGSSKDKDEPLPPQFTSQDPLDPADEERRVFYVACTRAKRRLVLIAKSHKGKSDDYFTSLTGKKASTGLAAIDGDACIVAAGALIPPYPQPPVIVPGPASAIDLESDRVWEHALAALHDASDGIATADELAAVQGELATAAASLSALAYARAHAEVPVTPDPPTEIAQRIAAILQQHPRPAIFEAPRAPLALSFSSITSYLECPRCWATKNLLGMREPATPHTALGTCIHSSLEQFAKQRREAESDGLLMPGESHLLALGRDQLTRWPAYLRLDGDVASRVDAQLRGAFQLMQSCDDQIIEIEHTVVFGYRPEGSDITHRITAKLDRIDRTHDGFRIVDYKTGGARPELLDPPISDLQMSIYALALGIYTSGAPENPDDLPIADVASVPDGIAEYWVLSKPVRGEIRLSALDLTAARAKIDHAIVGILAGRFEQRTDSKDGLHKYACRGWCAVLPKWL